MYQLGGVSMIVIILTLVIAVATVITGLMLRSTKLDLEEARKQQQRNKELSI